MGLAASQARLLSITSRMSDNELRSQLINNAKMRLTADTSRVSDEYIAALNKTQLMFTNFDPVGNEQYQDLTFNALTAYSSYNNQYGIVNSAGEIIVSKLDAANFAQSANLEEFLEKYGLEKKTDYFEVIGNSPEYVEKGIGYYDDFGVWQQMDTDIEEMEAIYEGEIDAKGINHYGQMDSLNSIEYGDYQKLVDNYQKARDNYKTTLKHEMKEWIAGESILNGNEFKYNGKTFETYYQQAVQVANSGSLQPSQKTDLVNAFLGFATLVGFTGNPLTVGGASSQNQLLKWYENPNPNNKINQPFANMLNYQLETLKYNVNDTQMLYSYTPGSPVLGAKAEYDANGNFLGIITGSTAYISETGTGDPQYIDGFGQGYISSTASAGSTKVIQYALNENNDYQDVWLRPLESGESAQYTDAAGNQWAYTYPGEAHYDNRTKKFLLEGYDGMLEGTPHVVTEKELLAAIECLYTNFRDNLMNNLSEEPFKKYNTLVQDAYAKYKDATAELVKFIYGSNAGQVINHPDFEDYLDYFADPSWVLSTNNALRDVDQIDADGDGVIDQIGDGLEDSIEKSHYNPWAGLSTTAPRPDAQKGTIGNQTYTISYQATKDLFLLDCMLEHYGMPNYTWIDKNNKDENGTAKATWYTNLYERMLQGFKEIDTGLAASQEWLQFAFESGLVHMEQVNKRSEWVSTLYSNCSMITESTVDVDVTIAEAKYKREMAKIEAKDKQYDIELKNIDTEHESLKQEYESIKEVITKNIDRNFKLFTQG